MKRTAPVVFGFLIGSVMLLQFFIRRSPFTDLSNLVLDWKQVVFGMTLILGVVSLLRHHGRKVRRKDTGWGYSTVALVGFAVVVLAALWKGTERGPYPWFFEYLQSPMQATMFSLLAFYVASASYRAFRARSVHAALLLLAGIVVMIGRVPLGEYFAVSLAGHHLSLPQLSEWLLDVPNLAAKRGILIGVGLGMTATALKILLGIERTYLGKSG
jgi:hypothetical protein